MELDGETASATFYLAGSDEFYLGTDARRYRLRTELYSTLESGNLMTDRSTSDEAGRTWPRRRASSSSIRRKNSQQEKDAPIDAPFVLPRPTIRVYEKDIYFDLPALIA